MSCQVIKNIQIHVSPEIFMCHDLSVNVKKFNCRDELNHERWSMITGIDKEI